MNGITLGGMPWHGLTWRGRLGFVWYRLRAKVVKPSPFTSRCAMGYPLGEDFQCPRRALDDELWCERHRKFAA